MLATESFCIRFETNLYVYLLTYFAAKYADTKTNSAKAKFGKYSIIVANQLSNFITSHQKPY
ncbi:hypothetical protein JCM19274_5421 [Algibacter lectus]|uniref:Uncharacterized protein n=1 Tax=Algibacter lectus TaxID=221126 RepID=A0A090WNA8_9FLAO|nr:hypothetical protein JCM19274_5421 [Algibacter lectus]